MKMLPAPFRYFGGKGNMIRKLMQHVPLGGRPYVEPYAGAASLLFARPPAPIEVLNDLDGDIVNLFRVLQDKKMFDDFSHRVRFTLYSRAENKRAFDILNSNECDPITRAWAFFVKLNQGFGGKNEGSWGFNVSASISNMACVCNGWIMRLSMLEDWHKRLLCVQIDNKDAIDVIKFWDNKDAVFYVDPPYHPDTRKTKEVYSHEQDEQHHIQLVETLLRCNGAVVLSGYDHEVYSKLMEAGWTKTTYDTACHTAGRTRKTKIFGHGAAIARVPRTECIWSNRRAIEMLDKYPLDRIMSCAAT